MTYNLAISIKIPKLQVKVNKRVGSSAQKTDDIITRKCAANTLCSQGTKMKMLNVDFEQAQ